MDLSRIINPPDDNVASAPAPPLPSPTATQLDSLELDDEENIVTDEEQSAPGISFIMEAKDEGKVTYASPSALELLGWDPEEVIGSPVSLFSHPDDAPDLYRAYQEMISEDKAACLSYFRLAYKDKNKGYLLCAVSMSRVGPHLIGACSPATSETKAMHNASTANEIIIITPSAARLAFRRWNVPSESELQASSVSPPPSSREVTPPSHHDSPEVSPKRESDVLANAMQNLTLSPPSKPDVAPRVAFVLDRFSKDVPVIYASNDDILPRSLVLGRSFYDFVTAGDERRVRTAMDTVKRWGVNETGSPSDGGFAFNRFHLYLRGRDSSDPQTTPLRKRRSLHAASPVSTIGASAATVGRKRSKSRITGERGHNAPSRDTMLVDVILSPQSDGIIVVLRPALQTGIMPT